MLKEKKNTEGVNLPKWPQHNNIFLRVIRELHNDSRQWRKKTSKNYRLAPSARDSERKGILEKISLRGGEDV